MKSTTILNALNECRISQVHIAGNRRPQHNFAILVADDPPARDYQRLDRIAHKCFKRLQARLERSDIDQLDKLDLADELCSRLMDVQLCDNTPGEAVLARAELESIVKDFFREYIVICEEV